ncbi:hypothetical protein D3C78_18770 [compost metagenome]
MITERDMHILEIVAKRRVVSRDQLIYLIGMSEISQAKNIINKRLRVLCREGFIEKTQPYAPPGDGSNQQLITLGRKGSNHLGLKWKPFLRRIRTIDGDLFLEPPAIYQHQLLLVDIEIEFEKVCKSMNYVLHSVVYEDKTKVGSVVPDMFIMIVGSGYGKPIFIEMDRGTESQAYVKKKLMKYKNLMLSGIWKDQTWAKLFESPPFPEVWVISTGTQNRINQIRKMLMSIKLSGESFHIRELPHKITVGQS